MNMQDQMKSRMQVLIAEVLCTEGVRAEPHALENLVTH